MTAAIAGTVLVLNSGSSSIKFQLVHPETAESVAHGLIERIGGTGGGASSSITPPGSRSTSGAITDHRSGLRMVLDMIEGLGRPLREAGDRRGRHRLVHGGEVFHEPR